MNELLRPFSYSFFTNGLIAAVLVGALCGLIGVYVVLRRMSYIGHGLSHAIFGGAVVSYVIGANFYLGAGLWGFGAALLINATAKKRGIGADAAIGIVTTASFAIGVALISRVRRFQRNIDANQPAYTLILYGTNDWNDPECQDNPDCYTVSNLRTVVRRVKALRSLPFIATLPPVNPALTPVGRNDWVAAVNDRIRAMAREEGAFLVDLHATFLRQPSLPPLYLDHVHFNPAGHDLASTAWFEAIAHGRSTP